MNGRREIVAQMIAEGKSPGEVADQVGYAGADSVQQALRSAVVRERIQFNRNEMFRQSKIDRVKLLKDIHGRITADHAEIFRVLKGEGTFLDAGNLEKLTPLLSSLIQQVECEPTLMDGKPVTVVKKIRFHSQDAAMKILARAAGFEDGALKDALMDEGGPFRGLIIIPPKAIETTLSQEAPPENPI